jgi:hypothetical protein
MHDTNNRFVPVWQFEPDGSATLSQTTPSIKTLADGLGIGVLVIDNQGRLYQRTNPVYLPWRLQVEDWESGGANVYPLNCFNDLSACIPRWFWRALSELCRLLRLNNASMLSALATSFSAQSHWSHAVKKRHRNSPRRYTRT